MKNRTDLIREVCSRYHVAYSTTKEWVSAIIDTMADMITEDELSLQRFGTFVHKKRAPRVGRHPVSGNRINIPARYVLEFVPTPSIDSAVRSKPIDPST